MAYVHKMPADWAEWAATSVGLPEIPEVPQVLTPLQVRWTQVPTIPLGHQAISLVPLDDERRRWQMQVEHYVRATYDHTLHAVEVDVASASHAQLTLANVLRFVVSLRLPLEGKGLMFHASSGGQARGALFAGVSTAGKSTLSLGFQQVEYYSDDISLVTFDGDEVWLTGAPFFGLFGKRGVQKRVPLGALCLLSKSDDDMTHIEKLPSAQALMHAMRHVVSFSNDAVLAQAQLDQLARLVERVPVFSVERSLATSSDDVFAQVMANVEAM